jgi:hypothetical protein
MGCEHCRRVREEEAAKYPPPPITFRRVKNLSELLRRTGK